MNCHVRFLPLFSLCSLAQPATAEVPIGPIATPDENVIAGAPIIVDVVKPTTHVEWPEQLVLRLQGEDRPQELTLFPVRPFAPDDMCRTCCFVPFQQFNGYGETLLNYDQSHGVQGRMTFSIVQ